MNPIVSIVIPCYNKGKYVRKTFNSVIAQKWDNIELVIINDGSVDETKDIISEYEIIFINRGYSVIIVEQENQGLAASVHKGLSLCSGKYVCQLDADDEFDSRFISVMVGWLEENTEYKWAACDSRLVFSDKIIENYKSFYCGVIDVKIESWIFSRIRRSISMYIIRFDYLKQCGVLEAFYLGKDANQEQQIFYPLVVGKGKIKYFEVPMCIKNHYELSSHRSYVNTYEQIEKYFIGRYRAGQQTVQKLLIEESEKTRLFVLLKWNLAREIIKFSKDQGVSPDRYAKWESELLEIFNTRSSFMCIMGMDSDYGVYQQGRIIAWGTLGHCFNEMYPYLKKSILNPDELWDILGDDVKVKKPNLTSLDKNDLVLIFPSSYDVEGCIRKELEDIGHSNYITYVQIESYCLYSQLHAMI